MNAVSYVFNVFLVSNKPKKIGVMGFLTGFGSQAKKSKAIQEVTV